MKILLPTKPVTLQDVFDYLHTELTGIQYDPPDNDFRRGYEQALSDIQYHFIRKVTGGLVARR